MVTSNPDGRPFNDALSDSEYCVLAMQIGMLSQPLAVYWRTCRSASGRYTTPFAPYISVQIARILSLIETSAGYNDRGDEADSAAAIIARAKASPPAPPCSQTSLTCASNAPAESANLRTSSNSAGESKPKRLMATTAGT